MASPGAIAKKHDQQIGQIIETLLVLTEAVEMLRSEIAGLKELVSKPATTTRKSNK